MHCFTGDEEELSHYLERDFYIGITGWLCDERRGSHLRDLVRNIPAERLLLETDAPYLLPRNVKPMPSHRRNEPMYLAHICAEVARDRGEDIAVTAANATAAARSSFPCRRAEHGHCVSASARDCCVASASRRKVTLATPRMHSRCAVCINRSRSA